MKKNLLLVASVIPLIAIVIISLHADADKNTDIEQKAIWQDPNNVVLIWETAENCTYKILRSSEQDGVYEYIGSSDHGSFRDDTAVHPNPYFYKIEITDTARHRTSLTEPVEAIVSPEDVSSVSVIMYHNFITEEDIKNGIEFEEYSISPDSFEEDLIWLRDNGYVTITSDDLLRHLEEKTPLPQKAVIISIDDGTWGVYTNAWPLLKKYHMKADFNVIGALIDSTWEALDAGGTRAGDPAPYCTWEELVDMEESGEINICSHTYGLHVYDRNGRIGMSMKDGESAEDFAAAVREDHELVLQCIEGWTGNAPETVAYPYSKRSDEGDRIVLDNTGYKVLMAGKDARGTIGNYFVTGCDISDQFMLMSRPCRMDGTPIGDYLNQIIEVDSANGVNG